ncbi:MAG: hypothetical protein QF464_03760 [Myxococcota bacterium]|jgi:TM2 domain-containing membrane protein YozV|nr:hypothetical protein [Myxococcota bacterium]
MYESTPSTKVSTTASRFAWMPLVVGAGGVAFGAATGGLGWLVTPVALAAAGGGGFWLWRKHKVELVEHQEKRFETLALAAFRRHEGATMTKEQLVRDHRLHPDEADAVLNWLVTHDLLTANWEDYDGPLVYERSDAAAGLPIPAPSAQAKGQPQQSGGRRGGPVVVHQHHAPPRPFPPPPFKSPGAAMLFSFFWPGTGQMYAGNVGRGLAWMFGTWFGYALIIPGFIAHIINIFDARTVAEQTNRHIEQFGTLPGVQRPPPPSLPRHPGYVPGRPPGRPPFRPPRS